MTPDDIEQLFQSRKSQNGDQDDISEQEKQFRVLELKEVALYAQHAWLSGSEELDLIAEKLGDGSRDASWRVPIGDSGVLDFFLSILPVEGLRQPLRIHTLRVIGNSCADTDENRARVVQSNQISSLVNLFRDDSILPFLIPVIYNVCVDYEPAQLEACKARLSPVLVALISSPRLMSCLPFLNIICKILGMLVTQEPEIEIADPATPTILLDLATNRTYPPDLEDFAGLTSVSLAYLAHEKFQTHFLTTGHADLLLQAFEDSYTRFDLTTADGEEADSLKQIWTTFINLLADLSAHPSFATAYPINSPLTRRLIRWLGSPSSSNTYLQTAACLSLGNLARSDTSSISLLHEVYTPVAHILTIPPSGQLLHALLSFLKNLAIPLPNKPPLGTLLLDPPSSSILSRLWTTSDVAPQTQFAAVSLTRLLIANSPENTARLCAPLSPDPDSPAYERTNLHVLASLISRSDTEPTKLEGARTIAAVCRVLHSNPDQTTILTRRDGEDDTATRERFYRSHEQEISKALADLTTQTKFPALRSEALFVMALMSRSEDGAKVVCRALHPFEACRALVETVSGRSMVDGRELTTAGSGDVAMVGGGEMDAVQGLGLEPRQVDPAQAASMARVDRENGMVLVAEILKQEERLLPPYRRSVFEEMLKAGGELVLNEREKDSTV